jgi:hypothetical protein
MMLLAGQGSESDLPAEAAIDSGPSGKLGQGVAVTFERLVNRVPGGFSIIITPSPHGSGKVG